MVFRTGITLTHLVALGIIFNLRTRLDTEQSTNVYSLRSFMTSKYFFIKTFHWTIRTLPFRRQLTRLIVFHRVYYRKNKIRLPLLLPPRIIFARNDNPCKVQLLFSSSVPLALRKRNNLRKCVVTKIEPIRFINALRTHFHSVNAREASWSINFYQPDYCFFTLTNRFLHLYSLVYCILSLSLLLFVQSYFVLYVFYKCSTLCIVPLRDLKAYKWTKWHLSTQ